MHRKLSHFTKATDEVSSIGKPIAAEKGILDKERRGVKLTNR